MNSGSTSNLSHHKNKIDVNVNKQAMMLDRFLKSGSNSEHIVCTVYIFLICDPLTRRVGSGQLFKSSSRVGLNH